MIIGYARVSTDGQTLDAQQASLKAAGAEKVFAEKVSGANMSRAGVLADHAERWPRARSAGHSRHLRSPRIRPPN